MLIRLNTVGNVIISDLNVAIHYGNSSIINLTDTCTEEQIKKSMKSPDGNLYQLLKDKVIIQVNPNSPEYKKQCQEIDKNIVKQKHPKINNPKQEMKIVDIMKYLKEQELGELQKLLTDEYFDNLSVLQGIVDDDHFAPFIRKKAKELLNARLDEKIDEKFVVV